MKMRESAATTEDDEPTEPNVKKKDVKNQMNHEDFDIENEKSLKSRPAKKKGKKQK